MKKFILFRARFTQLLKNAYKYVFCILTILGILSFAGSIQANQNQSPENKKEIMTMVLADADEWKNSGVTVKKGMKYKISATGRWSLGPICGTTGPDGIGNSAICGGVFVPGSGSLLVGKIGDQGRPFAIGSGMELTAPEDGILYFSVNGGIKLFCSGHVNVNVINWHAGGKSREN